MSTILDALKKSEQERKKNNVPTLSDMPVPEESARWPLYVIAGLSFLLAVLLGVIIANWLGSRAPETQSIQEPSPTTQPTFTGAINDNAPQVAFEDVVVNVVSYSSEPSQRFVMLNGKMYRENDFVRAGLKVEEIKPNAVVLNLRGDLLTRTP